MMPRAVVGACVSMLAFLVGVRALERVTVSDHILQALRAPDATFRSWVSDYNKPYAEGSEEYTRRFEIWRANVDYIHQYNQQHHTHWLGLNSFADFSFDEFKEYPKGYDYQAQLKLEQTKSANGILSAFRYEDVPDVSLPKELNWVEKGAVTEVKNQAQCGSCWAFSTTGSIEGINFIKTGTLEVLSEQELVDCDHAQDNGCMGGLMDYAFQFVIENGGLDTEKDYAYTAQNGVCNVKKEHRHVVTIDAYEDVPRMSQNALLKAVAHQPVSVAIQANERAFQLYAGGVLTDDCGTALDHGVLLVGYGRENNTDYWLVKNSWGALWGEKGYIKLERTTAPGPGKCGIAMLPSYPVKEHDNPPRPPRPSPDPPTPPGPAPNQPVKCDAYTQCMPRTTCCCLNELLGMCLQWACCPMPQATCCDDHRHCCPHNLPVCDVANSRCLPKGASYDDPRGVPLLTKLPAIRFGRGADAIRVG